MDRPTRNDIAAFPELFEGLEEFLDEQAARWRRTGATLAGAAVCGGMLLAWLAQRAA